MTLTDEQREVVERIKASRSTVRPRGTYRPSGAPRKPMPPRASFGEPHGVRAARWAKDHGLTLTEAADLFEVTRQAVAWGWRKVFPLEPFPRVRRVVTR